MFGLSPLHWIVVLVVIVIFFGRGRISETMGDFGKGIRSFKKGLAEEEGRPAPPPPAPQIAAPPPPSETPAPAPTAENTGSD